MLDLETILEHKDIIATIAKKHGFEKVYIAVDEPQKDYPLKLILESYSNIQGNVKPFIEEAKQYYKDLDIGTKVITKNVLEYMIQNEESHIHQDYLLDSAIQLTSLTNEPLIAQFNKQVQKTKQFIEDDFSNKENIFSHDNKKRLWVDTTNKNKKDKNIQPEKRAKIDEEVERLRKNYSNEELELIVAKVREVNHQITV
ncbi:hypothetical protein H1Q59_06845 [Holosporaceae bacterium 'Namur']|nr:hypothetical protein [Holosporaceae bacterium 'Namur']